MIKKEKNRVYPTVPVSTCTKITYFDPLSNPHNSYNFPLLEIQITNPFQ